MSLTQTQLDSIKTVIETDASGDGYVVTPLPTLEPLPERSAAQKITLDDVVDKFNAPRGLTVSRGPAQKSELWAAVKDVAASLTTTQQTTLTLILTAADAGFDVSDAGNIALIDDAIPTATHAPENAALKSLANNANGSRAQALVGRNVTRAEIAQALYGDAR